MSNAVNLPMFHCYNSHSSVFNNVSYINVEFSFIYYSVELSLIYCSVEFSVTHLSDEVFF